MRLISRERSEETSGISARRGDRAGGGGSFSDQADVRIGLAAPLTGRYSSGGAETERGAEAVVADLNAGGGVLGEQIEIITADDYCEGEQALAAANKLLAAGVVAVFGHQCSGAAIPASKVYAEAEILLISNEAFPSTPPT